MRARESQASFDFVFRERGCLAAGQRVLEGLLSAISGGPQALFVFARDWRLALPFLLVYHPGRLPSCSVICECLLTFSFNGGPT